MGAEPDLAAAVSPGPAGSADVAVRARPGSRRPGVTGTHDGAVVVRVAAPAEQGRANAELERTIAAAVGVRPSAVAVVRGATSRTKQVRVTGLDADEVRSRLAAAVGEADRRRGG